jgi:DNA-binding response OmpR family regulator
MIVDDEPENLKILEFMLNQEGYDISAFTRGDMALNAAMDQAPDLVLLDIRMPNMDGYTFCEHFKKVKSLKEVPILFLSALTDLEDKVRAFDAGGVDYISKPFSEREVIARVKTHLQLRQYQLSLQDLVNERTRKLSEAYRRLKIWDEAKSTWLNMLSHEIRTPLIGLFGAAQLYMNSHPNCHDNTKRMIRLSMDRINKLIDDALLIIQLKMNSSMFFSQMVTFDIQGCIKEIVNILKETIIDIDMVFYDNQDLKLEIISDYSLLFRAFHDLIMTATKCLLPGNKLMITVDKTDGCQWVYLNGVGNMLKEKDINTFFTPFGQQTLYKPNSDFGLGPTLAKSIINLFKGVVSVKNDNNYNKFVISICFPLQHKKMDKIAL